LHSMQSIPVFQLKKKLDRFKQQKRQLFDHRP